MEESSEKKNTFYALNKVASATECTGLMASLPQNEDEDESFAALYSVHDVPPTESVQLVRSAELSSSDDRFKKQPPPRSED